MLRKKQGMMLQTVKTRRSSSSLSLYRTYLPQLLLDFAQLSKQQRFKLDQRGFLSRARVRTGNGKWGGNRGRGSSSSGSSGRRRQ
jgi:hypothetical protein